MMVFGSALKLFILKRELQYFKGDVMKVYFFILFMFVNSVVFANWSEATKSLSSVDTVLGSSFGYSVDVGKKFAVVGAGNDGAGVGAAFVFKREDNGTWTQMQKLSFISGVISIGGFGKSVALAESSDENTNPDLISIGAPDSTFTIHGITTSTGAVCTYELNTTTDTWQQQQSCFYDTNSEAFGYSLDVSNYTNTATWNGSSIVLSLAYMIVGDPLSDANESNSGMATFYSYNANDHLWIKQTTLYNDVAELGNHKDDQFGYSVAIAKNIALIGAPYTDAIYLGYTQTTVYNLGSAYLYNNDGNLIDKDSGSVNIIPGSESDDTNFGRSVDMDEQNAIIGARKNTGIATSNVSISGYNKNGWTGDGYYLDKPTTNDVDFGFGKKVAIYGTHAVISDFESDSNINPFPQNNGVIFIYDLNTSSNKWDEIAHYYGEGAGANLGQGISVYEDTVMASSYRPEEKVKVYNYTSDVKVNPAVIMYLLN